MHPEPWDDEAVPEPAWPYPDSGSQYGRSRGGNASGKTAELLIRLIGQLLAGPPQVQLIEGELQQRQAVLLTIGFIPQ